MNARIARSVPLLVVALAALLSACGGAEDRRARALERGQQFLAEENYTKARIEFSNALQIETNDADARYFAAFATEKLGDLRAAVGGYRSALTIEPEHPLAVAALGRIYVFSGLAQEALDMVGKSLAAHPGHTELLVVRAAARIALGQEPEALADAEAVRATQPDHEYAVALLAGIHRKRSEPERGAALVEDVLARRPRSVDLRLVLAQLHVDLENYDRAEVELEKIVELRPTELQYRQQLVAFFAQRGRKEDAEATLRELIALEPESVDFKLALADFVAAQRSFDAGKAVLEELIAAAPGDDRLKLGAGQFYERFDDFQDDAERMYREVVASSGTEPAGLTARNRLAARAVRAGRGDDARALIDEVLRESPQDNDALVLRATLALTAGRTLDAITDLRAVVRDQPDSAPLLRTLARAHAENDERQLAGENYRRALQVDPLDNGTRLEYARYLLGQGDVDGGRQLLEAALEVEPRSLDALRLQFGVQRARGDIEEARRTAQAVVEHHPEDASGYYFQGLVDEASGDPAAAVASFEAALERTPGAIEPMTALARVLVATGRKAEARTRLEAIVGRFPDHGAALNLLAELMLSERDVAAATALTRQAIDADPKWWVPYRTQALIGLAEGSTANAEAAYVSGMAATGDAAPLGMDLAALYERDSRPDRAIEVYERLHQRDPGADALANNLAMLLSTYRDDTASHERAWQLVRDFRTSENPAYLDTYGWVRYRQGQVDEAVTALRRATDAAPDNLVMRYHLGMALLARGDRELARAELEKALATEQSFPGRDAARQALASLPGKTG